MNNRAVVASLVIASTVPTALARAEQPWARPVLPYPTCPGNLAPAVKVEPTIADETAPGEVTVEYDVTAGGATLDVRVVESSRGAFDRAVVDAVSKWRFAPTAHGYLKCRTRYVYVGIRQSSAGS